MLFYSQLSAVFMGEIRARNTSWSPIRVVSRQQSSKDWQQALMRAVGVPRGGLTHCTRSPTLLPPSRILWM